MPYAASCSFICARIVGQQTAAAPFNFKNNPHRPLNCPALPNRVHKTGAPSRAFHCPFVFSTLMMSIEMLGKKPYAMRLKGSNSSGTTILSLFPGELAGSLTSRPGGTRVDSGGSRQPVNQLTSYRPPLAG